MRDLYAIWLVFDENHRVIIVIIIEGYCYECFCKGKLFLNNEEHDKLTEYEIKTRYLIPVIMAKIKEHLLIVECGVRCKWLIMSGRRKKGGLSV